MTPGHRIWVFPDGDLPPRQPSDPALTSEVHGHESLVVLNPGNEPARIQLRVYFAEREPWEIVLPEIPPRRVACYRTDEPLGAERRQIPSGQYALVLECSQPVVAQIGRMDVRQANLAYYTVMGFAAEQ